MALKDPKSPKSPKGPKGKNKSLKGKFKDSARSGTQKKGDMTRTLRDRERRERKAPHRLV